MKKRKKIKWHLKLKAVFILFLFLFLIILGFYYIINLHIKNIYIYGNDVLSDKEIIEAAGIKDYPKYLKYSSRSLKKNISSLELVDSVKVTKSIFGSVSITVEEAKVLFYDRNNSNYVLSNSKTINDGSFTGIPFLINYVPSSIYERLIKELSKIKYDSISQVSEMEYSPSMSGDVVIDDTRFLFRMNDGNQVYINLINIDRLDMYTLIYSGLSEKGILELDSDNDNVYFHH